MKHPMRKLLWILALVPMLAVAQPTQEEARRMAYAEAQRQGVDPAELERRLQARGVNTATLTMSDIPRIQPIVEEEIAKMKAEQAASASIEQAVESGSLSGTEMAADGQAQSEASIQTTTTELASESVEVVKTKVDSKTPVEVKIDADQANTMVFGKHIFTNGSLNLYEVSKDYIPNDSYILGPGDVVTVSIFGKSQADLQFTIKPDGFIEPANLPKIYLKGISLGQAREVVRRRLQNFYQFEKGQFALTLTTARTLTIQITGAVAQPGTYTLSAYNTAFNALIAAGGPTKLGTVRNVQVINGGRVKELDVYEYLFNPQKQSDYYLQNNDILYVPFIGDLVEIKGSVKQVGVFEMKEKETFKDLLEYAGGYLSDALEDEIQLVRKNKEGSYVKEYSGDALAKLTFEDGDKVIVATETSDKKDYVEVNGWVNYPGIYGIRDYPTVKEVLQKVGVREETRMDVAYLTRTRLDGTRELIKFNPAEELAADTALALLPEDQITIFNIRDFVDKATVAIEGAVRQPGTFALDDNANVAFLIDLAKGLKQDAKLDLAYLFRENPDGTTEIETLNLEDILSGASSFELRDKDVLRVLSEKAFIDASTVSIVGAVRNPIELTVDSALTVSAMVDLANGLKRDAKKDLAYVFRTYDDGSSELLSFHLQNVLDGTEEFEVLNRDQIRILSASAFIDGSKLSIVGSVRNPISIEVDSAVTIPAFINLASGLTKDARRDLAYVFRTYPDGSQEILPVNLEAELNGESTLKLQDKDQVRILSERTYYDGAVLSISGEVRSPMEMPYDSTITLDEVLNLAGGLTFAGDSARIVVYSMDFEGRNIGKVKETMLDSRTAMGYKFKPFDAIVVRRKAGFEFQEYVTIRGEVAFPGRYAIREGEKVGVLIRKAGGLTKEAFPSAASFNRQGKGKVFISIDRILKAGNTYNNIELLPGDELFIPSKDMTVEIRLANTEAAEYAAFADEYARESVHVAYVAGKSSRWYIKNMVGGYGENAKRSKTNVVYANGTVKDYKWYRPFYRYPKVKPGAMVVVGSKPEKEKKEPRRERQDFNWQEFSANLMAQTTSILSIYVLATRL
jgi:protein involved in polysaccharide export with SLBB domain